MPLPSTLQLVLRPTPQGLDNHHHSVTEQAVLCLGSDLLSDLIIQTSDGSISCHQSILAPLSPFLRSILHSFPTFPGLVHTMVVPMKRKTVETIMKIIYTGKAIIPDKAHMDQVQSGMKLLDIHLPDLVFFGSGGCPTIDDKGTGLHSTFWGDDEIIETPSVSTVTEPTIHTHTSIVLPPTTPLVEEVKPLLPVPIPPHNMQPIRLEKLRVQLDRALLPLGREEFAECSVEKCTELVKRSTLAKHFKDHKEKVYQAFKCNECDKGFKDKKALEIHKVQHHCNIIENSVVSKVNNPVICENNNIEVESNPCIEAEGNKKRKRLTDDEGVSSERAAVFPEAPLACTRCSTPVSSTWYLPPSRHGCTVVTVTTPSGQQATSSSARKRSRKSTRRLSSVVRGAMPEVSDKTVSKTPEPNVTGDENNTIEIVVPTKVSHSGFNPSEPIPLQECPLANCARQCRTKADMQVHLAMTHYKDELEKDYITGI